MKKENLEFIGRGILPDGYNGNHAKVQFWFDPISGKTIAKGKMCFFSYHTPLAMDKKEAIWLLKNYPSSNVKFFETI
jgi:hypothetical protein